MTTRKYYNVHFTDERLEIEDFRMIEASSEDDARQQFKDNHYSPNQHELGTVEEAFELDMERIQQFIEDGSGNDVVDAQIGQVEE